MIRVVLDTNVLLSGVLSKAGVPGQILQAWQAGKFELVVSPPILAELAHALTEPYFRQRLSPADIVDLAAELAEQATLVEPAEGPPRIATHPEDDRILATAAAARVDFLVTGDKHLQGLGTYAGCAIVSPRAFLDLLAG